MKKITTLVISCSLALVAGAMAQQDDTQSSPAPNKHPHRQAAREARQAERQDQATPTNQASPGAETAPHRGRGRAAMRAQQEQNTPGAKADAETNANASANPNANPSPNGNANAVPDNPAAQRRAARRANMKNKADTATATPAAEKTETKMPGKAAAAKPATPAPSVAAEASAPNANAGPKPGKPNPQAQAKVAAVKKPEVVQKIKAQHVNFHALAQPQKVQSVTFNESYRIPDSQNWQGERYTVFRSYHPERHDRAWYRARYPRIELIAGGYYYFNNGYWVPAFGYEPSAQYYAYDGPIYAGRNAEPPDRVIADVQASLQEMGYYTGEVDGLLGPLTREALTAYQSDNGLYTTAAIDEPTLDSLGMGS